MLPAIAKLAEKAVVTSVTTRYYFLHTTLRDRKLGRLGYACAQAEKFAAACSATGLKVEFTIYDEEGTGVAVTEWINEP